MRRFLTTSFIALTLAIGAMGVAPAAHAQATGNPEDPCNLSAELGGGLGKFGPDGSMCIPNGAVAAAANTQTSPGNNSALDPAFNGIMTKIVSLFAWLVGVAALTLDYAVFYTVVNMGSYLSHLTAIGVTWRILRDIGNIMLIFGFLAIGITTILNVDWYGKGKKMLPMLLVAAIFLNFSLFFAEAVIDVGNLFATQFYTQINGGVTPTAFSLSSVSVANEGISNKLMAQLGLQTIYGNSMNDKTLFADSSPWYVGFMGIILFMVTAFVMFSLAFMLIARFVKLIYLIIIAPIGFAGLAVPQLAGRAKDWWGDLFAQTITAPVLLLLLYVALAVITDAQFLTGLGGGAAGAATGFVANHNLPGFASYLLSFIIAMGLMLAVTMSAKSLSAVGAGWATKSAGALTLGATALGMRTTVGWGANRAVKTLRGTRLARVPLVGTGIVKGLDKVATGSLDIRGAGLKNAGAAQKGGYRAELKERTESRTKYAAGLTGRELNEEEKLRIREIKDETKIPAAELKKAETDWDLKNKEVRERREALEKQKGTLSKEEYQTQQASLTAEMASITAARQEKRETVGKKEKEIEDIESVTTKGAQRKYASVLEAGLGEKSIFNKYVNFAANTEAAKKIRGEAKKSSDDKATDTLKALLKKAAGEEKPKEETPKPAEAAH